MDYTHAEALHLPGVRGQGAEREGREESQGRTGDTLTFKKQEKEKSRGSGLLRQRLLVFIKAPSHLQATATWHSQSL